MAEATPELTVQSGPPVTPVSVMGASPPPRARTAVRRKKKKKKKPCPLKPKEKTKKMQKNKLWTLRYHLSGQKLR